MITPCRWVGDSACSPRAGRARSYRTFIRGLLDITDNLFDGRIRPPDGVVCHDGDDSYLVVAADKGTARMSDVANMLAVERGFWLGDAFASGGSVGYDHKAIGITARGAWESVRRHFRELGVDTQVEEFTVVRIGEMSGDVFGNGMLLSPHIRLLAAFDHRHVFLDPNPDATRSFTERRCCCVAARRRRCGSRPGYSLPTGWRRILPSGWAGLLDVVAVAELTDQGRAALPVAEVAELYFALSERRSSALTGFDTRPHGYESRTARS